MAARHFGPIEVERIFLYEKNPRHEPIPSQPEIIEHLCKGEAVYNLARNIADANLNPLEFFGVVDLNPSGSSAKKSYQVWEGNRRVCAVKLLNDPDLAPAHLRKDFERLAKGSAHVPIKKINCVVFDDHDDLNYWMGIIHGGEQAGVGRRTWDSQQKERHFGSGRNRVALAVLDVAENLGLMTKEERDKKLTTAQRFLNNSVVREAIGIDTSNPDDITFNRPNDEFQVQLGRFIKDLNEGEKVTSRHNKGQIEQYGRKLAGSSSISGERVEPQSLKGVEGSGGKKSKAKTKPKKPRQIVNIAYEKELTKQLEERANGKLESLYHSLYTVRLEHAPLLTIGAWAFIESLTALAGKDVKNDFLSFYSNQRLGEYGFGTSNKEVGPIRDALTRIQKNGNTTKHHQVSALFDGKQLANDFATITPILVKTLESYWSQEIAGRRGRRPLIINRFKRNGIFQMPLPTSPLRYPGGKICLLGPISRILRLNGLERGHYAEPYAGGCGLALALLFDGFVSDIHINDVDRSIWALWSAVLDDTEELISRMNRTRITLAEWRRQREVQKNSAKADKMDLAFSTLFLNRTNRSGIIKNAGVIGGLLQDGDYTIDCRFNKEELARRMRRIRKYRGRIHLHRRDAIKFIDHVQENLPRETFLCIDPPYFSKGSSLYTSFYEPESHAEVAKRILKLKNPWVLTYDACNEIRKLYKTRRQFVFSLNYSAQIKRQGTELMMASKGLRMPDELRAAQVHRPQYRTAA